MHRFRAWGLSAALAAGATAPAVAADPPPRPTTVYAKLFGPSKAKPTAGPGTPAGPATVTAPLPGEVVAEALRAEQDAWERRMSVCLKLRQVAIDTNDDALDRQAAELERQATALYTARVAALGVPASRDKALKPRGDSSAEAIGSRVGTTPADAATAANRLTAPAAPTVADPAIRTADASTPVVSPPSGGVRP